MSSAVCWERRCARRPGTGSTAGWRWPNSCASVACAGWGWGWRRSVRCLILRPRRRWTTRSRWCAATWLRRCAAHERIYGVDRAALEGTGPMVVSINGAVASLAVTEFIACVGAMRQVNRHLSYYGHLAQIRRSEDPSTPDCYYCTSIRGNTATNNGLSGALDPGPNARQRAYSAFGPDCREARRPPSRGSGFPTPTRNPSS